MAKDFYQALEVARTASQEEIQRAYRRLARLYHPDVNREPGAEERFKEITEAYRVLGDPAARRRYDAAAEGVQRASAGWDFDMQPHVRVRRGAPAPGPAPAWTATPGFGDLFGDLYGERTYQGWASAVGAHQEAELEITVEEAYHGARRVLTLDGRHRMEIVIPPGFVAGQRLRIAGQGGRGRAGAPDGDLFLVVRIADHPKYRVRGRDIHVELRLAPWEAALGAVVPVDTPDGPELIKVPPGTSSGDRLRLHGRGLPNPQADPGDLYAEARIVVPASLSEDERRLFQQLADTTGFDPRRQS
ncbi:DnaJ C-terminal domain-containing protein [Nonomuraea dietziae]|uniref:DnaJ C-terminal domain-containing protein n=1 Tax=Nonomuraea dietziae TaxID=65515 RepID=UPI00343D4E46